MKRGFWDALPRPFFVLAPLADVTDPAFRRVIAKYSKPYGPHVMWTEFVSADGLVLAPEEGRKKLLADLQYSEIEKPIVAQFFTSRPETMEKASALARELGFDGIDINMGCPAKKVVKSGHGSSLMINRDTAFRIVEEMSKAVSIPVSVKTRLGWENPELLKDFCL